MRICQVGTPLLLLVALLVGSGCTHSAPSGPTAAPAATTTPAAAASPNAALIARAKALELPRDVPGAADLNRALALLMEAVPANR